MFAAVRFTGRFESVETRTVFCQCHPYPPLLEVVREQATRRFAAERGVMLGFRTPRYMQGVNVAGYHVHFLTEDHEKGGHVTGYRIAGGTLELAVIADVEIQLPRTPEFAQANLCPEDMHEAITQAEGD